MNTRDILVGFYGEKWKIIPNYHQICNVVCSSEIESNCFSAPFAQTYLFQNLVIKIFVLSLFIEDSCHATNMVNILKFSTFCAKG